MDPRTLLRRTAKWAWERDEVGRRSSRRTVRFTAAMYVGTLVVIVLAGGVLSAVGRGTLAEPLLVFGIWFTSFVGSINLTWEWLKYRSEQRDATTDERGDGGPDRELAPDLSLSDDVKIGLGVTTVALCTLYFSLELAVFVASFA